MRDKCALLKRMRLLFHDLHILCEMPAGTEVETFTSITVEQAVACGTVYYEDRCFTLWPNGSICGRRLARFVTSMEQRIEAELHPSMLFMDFAAFDIVT